jgi:hypothetical protein
MNFFFLTMEFRLSRSLFTNFLFLSGISAITGPFHEFFFLNGISAIKEPFHMMKFTKCVNWGKTLFIYITKSIYTRPASLKTLPLDLEPPLQGKEYGPLILRKL